MGGGGGRHIILSLELNMWQDKWLLWALPVFSSQLNTFCSPMHYDHHNKWLLPWPNDTEIYIRPYLDYIFALYGPSNTLCGKLYGVFWCMLHCNVWKNQILFTDFNKKIMKNKFLIAFWHIADEVLSYDIYIATNGLSSIELDCFIAIFT